MVFVQNSEGQYSVLSIADSKESMDLNDPLGSGMMKADLHPSKASALAGMDLRLLGIRAGKIWICTLYFTALPRRHFKLLKNSS